MSCPMDDKKCLGIKLPFLIIIVKNMEKYFTFEIQVGARALVIGITRLPLWPLKTGQNFNESNCTFKCYSRK